MNKFFLSAAAAFMVFGLAGQAYALPEPDMSPKYTYELKDVMKVDGRQGLPVMASTSMSAAAKYCTSMIWTESLY